MTAPQSPPGVLSKVMAALSEDIRDIAAHRLAQKHFIWLPLVVCFISTLGLTDFDINDENCGWQHLCWWFVLSAWTAHTHIVGQREGRAYTLWTLMHLAEDEREEEIAKMWKQYGWSDSKSDRRKPMRLNEKMSEKNKLLEV